MGCPPLFHSEAALVEVPSDLELLLCCHSLCHLPSHTETSGTNNPKVSAGFLRLMGGDAWEAVGIDGKNLLLPTVMI